MEIGWAVDKGLDVVKVSYHIYKSFRDPHANAPAKFHDLAKEFSTFHIVFSELLDVLKRHDKPLLVPLTTIQYTLEKCRLFQQKFSSLAEVTTKRTIKQGITFGVKTIQWSLLADKVANDLRLELASHTRVLTLCTETLNLRNTLEERVENIEIREQNREILHLLKSRDEKNQLNLPDVPRHQPLSNLNTALDLPDVPIHQPQSIGGTPDRIARLDNACRDLESLMHVWETERRSITDTNTSGPNQTSNAAEFIDLAKDEVQLLYERVTNYQKRLQHIPSRAQTLDDGVGDQGGDQYLPARLSTERQSQSSHMRITPGTGLQISVPIESASLGASHHSRRESMRRREESLPDDASDTRRKYLARFEDELKDLDEFDIDTQIEKTREELTLMLRRSFPPSPDLNLGSLSLIPSHQTSPNIQPSPSIDGRLSGSPPQLLNMPSSRRVSTGLSSNSRRGSVDANAWRYLAKDVHVDEVPYTCAKCSVVRNTALQMAQRASGGLSFRVVCISEGHRPSVIFRHDLNSTLPSYPHVYHRAANRGSECCVKVLGLPSKLEAYTAGQKMTLPPKVLAGPRYRFASSEDSESFEQLVYEGQLVERFDVRSVNSSAYTDSPPRHVAVRLWRSISSGSLSITLFASLVDKCEPFAYVQQTSSFGTPSTSGNKVKLKLADSGRPSLFGHKRSKSKDSSVSVSGGEPDQASLSSAIDPISAIAAKVRWIELEFETTADKQCFLSTWKGDG